MRLPRCFTPSRPVRGGFTLVEITAALAILVVVLALVAQVAVWILQERARLADYEAAQELAANVLERARARPWNDLTPEWAKEQHAPEPWASRDWKIEVQVAAEKSRPHVKRVTAAVQWKNGSKPPQSLEVMALFADRSSAARGEKP